MGARIGCISPIISSTLPKLTDGKLKKSPTAISAITIALYVGRADAVRC